MTARQCTVILITADCDVATGNAAGSADRFIGQLYAELGGK
jgi:hypothetical protein